MYHTTISQPSHGYAVPPKPLNILIVDDDDHSRDLMKQLIESHGHQVTALDEGMKCINRCNECVFDLIFMDYHTNDLDGEVNGADILGMARECFDIKSHVYAYTGDNTAESVEVFRKNDMKGVFVKPVSARLVDDFLTIIEKNMDNSSMLSRLAIRNRNFMYFGKPKLLTCCVPSSAPSCAHVQGHVPDNAR